MAKINLNDNKFLDKEVDIKHKDTVTIATEGEWNQSTKFKKDDGTPANQFEITITLANGEGRDTIFSLANLKLLAKAFGDDTATWVGKKVRAWKTKSEKAATGYVYVYAPIDWERDDTGEWVVPSQATATAPVQATAPAGGEALGQGPTVLNSAPDLD